ncbi:MAG: S8 family serine peptidase [Planctomycetaceae bacterium]
MFPRAISLNLVLLCIAVSSHAFALERCAVKPRPSRERRLAPELDLVRQVDCEFVGICRRGKSMYNVAREQSTQVKAMSVAVHNDPDLVGIKGSRLLINYEKGGQKPSPETLRAAGLNLVEDYERGSFLLVEPDGNITSQTVNALLDDDAVTYAEPDYIVTTAPTAPTDLPQPTIAGTVPNDPFLSQLWGMKNIRALQVWPTYRDSSSVIVAVIDTGVDYNHPDLKANMWTSQNGTHGFDFFDDDNDPMDEQNHGTHCAGTIAGVGHNGIGVVGVNWKARIMALRFSPPTAPVPHRTPSNASIGPLPTRTSSPTVGPDVKPRPRSSMPSRAEKRGVLFVAAAGNTEGGNNNDSVPYYPAAYNNANIIAVAPSMPKTRKARSPTMVNGPSISPHPAFKSSAPFAITSTIARRHLHWSAPMSPEPPHRWAKTVESPGARSRTDGHGS